MPSPPKPFRRAAGLTTLAAAPFMIAASVLFFFAAGASDAITNPAHLLGINGARIEAFRWGALTDVFGFYLLLVPMFLAVGCELARRDQGFARLSMLGGIAYALLGATAGIVLAYAGPPLLRAPARHGRRQDFPRECEVERR